jgi:RimJ/RimL family protein N-acetyltransferase
MPDFQLTTARLTLRHLRGEDAPFLVELLNDPDFLRFIGDRGVRSEDDAVRYLESGPRASYVSRGFGLYAVVETATGTAAGICGLLRREALDDVDVGFAFLPRFRGLGYAREAAEAVLREGAERFGLRRIVAIVSPANVVSARLLERLGFSFERMIRLGEGDEVRLFGRAM